MRRFLTPPLALVAGLAILLNGCSGESPTSPGGGGGGTGSGGGACAVSLSLAATSVSPLAGSAVIIRATAKRGGAPVSDGTSVLFLTDYGFFLENGLPSVSKLTVGGFADVTLASTYSGLANVKASLDCASSPIAVQFQTIPQDGPFVSSIQPNTGTCAGGDQVVINGGRFGTDPAVVRVAFSGVQASIISVTDTRITIRTPQRTLANAQVPEAVDVVVTVGAGTAASKSVSVARGFTYTCVDPNKRIFISSIQPVSGSPGGGDQVSIFGQNFGSSIATTRVTFGGVSAAIISQNDAQIVVTTPRRILSNPTVPEVVDVGVTIDLGLVSQQSALLPQAFTYRAASTGGTCNTDPGFFISSVTPNTGAPEGGTVVTITGGFGQTASLSTIRVDVGGRPAQLTAASVNVITISTPQRTLANPEVPETVDIVVTDNSTPSQTCARLSNAFTYTRVALDPVIFSVSPRTGPNDASTRITIFGGGFQFPMQVFLTGASCGTQRVEATVVTIKTDQIVFLSPIARDGNACLANQLVTIEVLNPSTGKKAQCVDCFKYYSCPSLAGASPSFGPYNQTTTVTLSGSNFAEPVTATFTGPGINNYQLTVTSVSAALIVVTMPPVDALQGTSGQSGCNNISGTINLTFSSLSCPPLSTAYTYRVTPPIISSAQPTQLNQDGSPLGSPLGSAPQTITVSGTGFTDPLTVVLLKDGAALAYTRVNNPSVSNPATLTFPAPGIKDLDMNQQACAVGNGVTGNRYVPSSFGIRVINSRTGCQADLPNVLIYNPADPTCRSAPVITTGPPVGATICATYPGYTFQAAGGTPPYFWAISGQPAGLFIDAVSGTLSGTPRLTTAGPGTPGTTGLPITVTVTDSKNQVTSQGYQMALTDPGGGFAIIGSAAQTISDGAFGSTMIAGPAAFSPITWSISVNPAPPAGIITLSSTTGSQTAITQSGVPSGSGPFAVTLTATDGASSCGGVSHQANPFLVSVSIP